VNTQPEKRRRRYLLWLSIIVVSLVLPIIVAAFKPLTCARGTRRYELSAAILKPGDPYHADRSGFFSTGWDGPTGEFSHGDIYGLKLGRLLIRLAGPRRKEYGRRPFKARRSARTRAPQRILEGAAAG